MRATIPSARELLSSLLPRGLALADGADISRRLQAALAWIETAHSEAHDGGISKGYDLLRRTWSPSYPETTGYTIPTLLNASTMVNRPDLRSLALDLAGYLIEATTPEGGVSHWMRRDSKPIVFDTGQVIFGWLAAYTDTKDDRYLRAAAKAGAWLVDIQDASGAWRQHQHLGVEKVIDTRVSWALLLLHQMTGHEPLRQAAIRNLEWAMAQQDSDGWFRHCAFVEGENPFTHTIAYTAEGLLESGILLGRDDLTRAGRLTADALIAQQKADGSLASTFGRSWRAASRSSCLTGDCQIGSLWLRLAEISGDHSYHSRAKRIISFVATTQILEAASRNLYGAIAGSSPIYGRYERLKYPNWATKFFADALMALALYEARHEARTGGARDEARSGVGRAATPASPFAG